MKGLAAVRTQVGQVCAEKGASPNTNSAAGMANKISPSAAAVMAVGRNRTVLLSAATSIVRIVGSASGCADTEKESSCPLGLSFRIVHRRQDDH